MREGYEGALKTLTQPHQLEGTFLVSDGRIEALKSAEPSQASERIGEPFVWELEEISAQSSESSFLELQILETLGEMNVRDLVFAAS